jgi:hypothetical protein
MQFLTNLETEKPCPWLSQLKPYLSQETLQDFLVNHYALIAMNKGSIDHARHMTRQYQTTFPTLSTLIAEQMKELRNEQTGNGFNT